MQIFRACALFIVLALPACGGSQPACGQHVPDGPIPAGTPIPVQPMPAGAGISGTASVTVDFVTNADGTVTSDRVQVSSGNPVVDNAALQIVKTTPFHIVEENCDGQPVREGFVWISFSSTA